MQVPFVLYLEVQSVVFQLIDEVTQDLHIVGGHDVGGQGHFLDGALVGVGHAGEEVDEAAGNDLVGLLQVEHHGALLPQMVGDLRGVFKPLGLDQHHLKLGGGVDVDHLVAAPIRLATAGGLGGGGVAVVDRDVCVGCGVCANTCPKSVIQILTKDDRVAVRCKSTDKGAAVMKNCKNGCIGCKKCENTCKFDAIHVENNLASIDYDKCKNCGLCAKECPTGAIVVIPKEKKVVVQQPAEEQAEA